MSAPVASLTDAFRTVRANPTLIIITAAALFGAAVVGGILSLVPVVGGIVSNAIIGAAGGGVVATIAAGTEQQTTDRISLDALNTQLSSHGKTLIGTYLLASLANVAITIGILLVTIVTVGLSASSLSAIQSNTAQPPELGIILVLPLLILPAALLLIFIPFQFLNVAVVMGDRSVTGAFREAYDITTSNPLSVVGYSLLQIVFAIGSLILLIAIIAGSLSINETLGFVLLVVLGPTIGSVVLTMYYAHHTHYYRRLNAITRE